MPKKSKGGRIKKTELAKLKDTIGLPKPKPALGHQKKRTQLAHDNQHKYNRKRSKSETEF